MTGPPIHIVSPAFFMWYARRVPGGRRYARKLYPNRTRSARRTDFGRHWPPAPMTFGGVALSFTSTDELAGWLPK